jgi:hypothetical protein
MDMASVIATTPAICQAVKAHPMAFCNLEIRVLLDIGKAFTLPVSLGPYCFGNCTFHANFVGLSAISSNRQSVVISQSCTFSACPPRAYQLWDGRISELVFAGAKFIGSGYMGNIGFTCSLVRGVRHLETLSAINNAELGNVIDETFRAEADGSMTRVSVASIKFSLIPTKALGPHCPGLDILLSPTLPGAQSGRVFMF